MITAIVRTSVAAFFGAFGGMLKQTLGLVIASSIGIPIIGTFERSAIRGAIFMLALSNSTLYGSAFMEKVLKINKLIAAALGGAVGAVLGTVLLGGETIRRGVIQRIPAELSLEDIIVEIVFGAIVGTVVKVMNIAIEIT